MRRLIGILTIGVALTTAGFFLVNGPRSLIRAVSAPSAGAGRKPTAYSTGSGICGEQQCRGPGRQIIPLARGVAKRLGRFHDVTPYMVAVRSIGTP